MKKTKLEKGITLIALIITIIVLLILAVVTIGSIKDSKIITYAQNAANGYEKSKDNEVDVLDGYEQLIEENNPNVKKVDYDVIAQILTSNIQGLITEEECVIQLKKHLSIVDEDIIKMTDIAHVIFSDSTYVYIYEIDSLYKLDNNAVLYVTEDDNLEQYTFGRNIKEIKNELENVFIGRTVSETQEKYNEGELSTYVVNNSDSITSINFKSIDDETGEITISSLTFSKGEGEINLSRDNDNYTMEIQSKEGIYYKVIIEWRNLI